MIKLLIIALIFVASAQTDCNVCQSSNNVACHGKNQFSLCIDGAPSRNFISCQKDYVCTAGRNVCYPQSEAEPSCDSMCNVCNDKKVFACKNETTITFCYGKDRPDEGANVAHCIENTICDIYRKVGFCTEIGLAKPSCVTDSGTNFPNTTIEPASPTEELTSEGSAVTEPTHSASETSTTISETTATTTTSQTTAATTAETSAATTITTTSGTTATTTTTTETTAATTKKPIATTTTSEASSATTETTAATTTTRKPIGTTTRTSGTSAATTTTTKPIATTTISEASGATTTETTAAITTTRKPIATKTTTSEASVATTTTETTAATTTTRKPIATTTTTSEASVATTTTATTAATTTTRKPIATTTTTSEASVATTTIEQVNPSVPLDPDTVCRDADRVGFYSSGDPTCKSFIICYDNGHAIAGIKQFCKKGQYFPPGATYCSSNKPDVCI